MSPESDLLTLAEFQAHLAASTLEAGVLPADLSPYDDLGSQGVDSLTLIELVAIADELIDNGGGTYQPIDSIRSLCDIYDHYVNAFG